MSDLRYGLIQLAIIVVVLVCLYRPLGGWLAKAFTSDKDWAVERWLYRAFGADQTVDQRWTAYARSLILFSAGGFVTLYAILRLQPVLPLGLGRGAQAPDLAFNTAASFTANTNWQSYSGETLGHFAQMAGLTVQNFLSAASGICVAAALVRGFARRDTDRVGNFWRDLVRVLIRVLLPIAFVAATVFILSGVIQNLNGSTHVVGIAGIEQTIPGGPTASQEAIKLLGTNGGGFFNANSAHPFENPTVITNLVSVLLILCIPFALPNAFGRMVGSARQGLAIAAAMTVLALGSWAVTIGSEIAHKGAALQAIGASLEGKELRFGVPGSSLFSTATTLTSTGAVDSMHSSHSALSGGMLILNMAIGEVAPGGVGSGLYGMLVIAVLAVFVAGLMVGRTPEFLGKQIGSREMKLVALYILIVPAVVLVGTGVAIALPGVRASMLNGGAHGFSEVLYAYTSAANNNGSAFAGLSANTTFLNTTLGLAMLIGRFLPMILILALAGSLAGQGNRARSEGTLRTDGPLFIGLVVGVTLIVAALTFFPALSLGPLAEGLSA